MIALTNLLDYFKRRFWRVYPLYWIVMLAGLGMCAWRNTFSPDIERLGWSGMLKSFLIFPQEPFPFWQPGWSLEHEILFYIIAALIVPFLGLRVLALVMWVLGLVGLTVATGWDFHLFRYVQIYFGAGVLAYLLRNRSWREAGTVAAVLLTICYLHLYGVLNFPVNIRTIAFAFGFAALIVMLLDIERRGWSPPAKITAIGDASYSLYLWHWMVIPFAGWGHHLWGGPPELWRWVIVIASVLVSLISFRLLEQPIMKIGQSRRMSRRSIAAE